MSFSRLSSLRTCVSGATSIEYALIAAIISLSIVVGVVLIRGNLEGIYNNISGNMP